MCRPASELPVQLAQCISNMGCNQTGKIAGSCLFKNGDNAKPMRALNSPFQDYDLALCHAELSCQQVTTYCIELVQNGLDSHLQNKRFSARHVYNFQNAISVLELIMF